MTLLVLDGDDIGVISSVARGDVGRRLFGRKDQVPDLRADPPTMGDAPPITVSHRDRRAVSGGRACRDGGALDTLL